MNKFIKLKNNTAKIKKEIVEIIFCDTEEKEIIITTSELANYTIKIENEELLKEEFSNILTQFEKDSSVLITNSYIIKRELLIFANYNKKEKEITLLIEGTNNRATLKVESTKEELEKLWNSIL